MVCQICRKEFTPNTPRQILCGDKECSAEHKRRWNRKYSKDKRELDRHNNEFGVTYDEPSKVRECLKCKKPFESHGFRICPKCHRVNLHTYSETAMDGFYK